MIRGHWSSISCFSSVVWWHRCPMAVARIALFIAGCMILLVIGIGGAIVLRIQVRAGVVRRCPEGVSACRPCQSCFWPWWQVLRLRPLWTKYTVLILLAESFGLASCFHRRTPTSWRAYPLTSVERLSTAWQSSKHEWTRTCWVRVRALCGMNKVSSSCLPENMA